MSGVFRSSQMNRRGMRIVPLLSALVLIVGLMSATPASAVAQAAPGPSALATAAINEAQFSRLIAQVEQTRLVLAKAEPTKTRKRPPRRGWLRKIGRRFDRKILQRAKRGLSKITTPVRRIGRKSGEAVGWFVSQPVSLVDRRAGKKAREDLQRILGGAGSMLAQYKFGGTTFGKRVSRWGNQLERATAAVKQIRDLPTRKEFQQRFEDWAGRRFTKALNKGRDRVTRRGLKQWNKLKQKVQHKANRILDRARKKVKSAEQRLRSARERLREIEEKAKWVTNPEEKARLELERKALKHRARLQTKVKKRLEPLRRKVEERVQRLEEGFQERVQRLEKKRDEKLRKIDEKLERLKKKGQKVEKKLERLKKKRQRVEEDLERLRRVLKEAGTPPIVPGGATDKEEAKDKSPFVDDDHVSKKRDGLLASREDQRDQRLKKRLEDDAYGIQKGVNERKKLFEELEKIGVKVEQGTNTKKLRQALKDAKKKAKQKKEKPEPECTSDAECVKKYGEGSKCNEKGECVKVKPKTKKPEPECTSAPQCVKIKGEEGWECIGGKCVKVKPKTKEPKEEKKRLKIVAAYRGSGLLKFIGKAQWGVVLIKPPKAEFPVQTQLKLTFYEGGSVLCTMVPRGVECNYVNENVECKKDPSEGGLWGMRTREGLLAFNNYFSGTYNEKTATITILLKETNDIPDGGTLTQELSGKITLSRIK